MKICAYVPGTHAKENYKVESLEQRMFFGLHIIKDTLERAGFSVDWAGSATVHQYDIVLVSITSDCDWWPFISERKSWRRGNYKVVVGGAGVLNVRPFLRFADYFVLGRGEKSILGLLGYLRDGAELPNSVVESSTFDVSNIYRIEQADKPYPHTIAVNSKLSLKESTIGCNHRCFFCGYTWHRKSNCSVFKWDFGNNNMSDKECALLDYDSGAFKVDFSKLRTTAIDGFSEALRFSVNKKITHELLCRFLRDMVTSEAKPHQLKIFNICGLPGETTDDWHEFVEALRTTENLRSSTGKQWSIVLHTTPFRPMPATPLASKPMSYRNYRGEIARVLGQGKYKGNIFYQGNSIWAVESMGTESLATVIQSAIVLRGTEEDSENILRVAQSRAFAKASTLVKQATLEKYFDVATLFGAYTEKTLPTRYLRTYAKVEKMWVPLYKG